MDNLLQSHTAWTMLTNSECLAMLNQAATDRVEQTQLLKISDNQLSHITNVDSDCGLIKCGSARMQYTYCTPIIWAEAQPGGFAFYTTPMWALSAVSTAAAMSRSSTVPAAQTMWW